MATPLSLYHPPPSIHTLPHSKPRKKPPPPPSAVLSSKNEKKKTRILYELKKGQTRLFHELPSGLSMEVIVQERIRDDAVNEGKNNNKPPLVFVHGSYHAGWCWAEHWLPFFSSHGFDCFALSLLGQGESDVPSASVAGTLQTHAADVANFIEKRLTAPPVLLGHSFGGLIVQYYVANIRSTQPAESLFQDLEGAVLLCSVPPSGNSGIVWRYILSKPIVAFKVTRSLAAKAFQTSLPLCKETFFSAAMEDLLVLRYQNLMKESSRIPLFDLRKLNASLPVPSVTKSSIELLVLGASDDFIVDAQGLKETAEFYGVEPICIEGVAHDMMLDCSWEKGANVILSWLKELKKDHIQ